MGRGPPPKLRQPIRSNAPCWCGSGRKYKRCHRAERDLVLPGEISPRREVPSHIVLPDYARDGMPVLLDEPMAKSPETIDRMRRAGLVAARVLQVTAAALEPGVTTDALDAVCHEATIELGAYPSPLNYHGFPKSICTSVNEVICHGIPDSRPVAEGDIVNLDVTVYLQGVHGDTSATFAVGRTDAESERLVRVTEESLQLGIAAVAPGRPVSDIGRAIERHAEGEGYSVIRAFCGHGIGEVFHSRPQIPHYFDPRASTVIEPNMTFTIEPMIAIGTWRHASWDDGWTAVTADRQRTAQFEHTILVTPTGAEVLTRCP
ncbi:MAG: type I methionyl aminopeptidase [Acidimicrobiales bacterium]